MIKRRVVKSKERYNVISVKKGVSKILPTDALPIGTLKCPICGQPLEFRQIYGLRLIENDLLKARCKKDSIYFDVKVKI